MISKPAMRRTRLFEAVLVLVGAIAVAGFVLAPQAGYAAPAACAAVWFLAVVCELFRGRVEGILSCWVAVFPLGYFAMFPRDHPIVTLERMVLLLACLGLLFVKPSTLVAVPMALRRTGVACLAFVGVAGVTLVQSPNVLGSVRLLLDNFVVPLLFGWCVIAWFDVRRWLPTLHTAVCISSIICATIAAAEIVTAEDLLPVENSAMYFTGGIARPNGPFASNDQLALIGGISLFFLLFLFGALGPRLRAGRKVLHSVGLAAAIGMALMPVFRSVALTLLLVMIIDTFWEQRTSRRAWRCSLIAAFVALIFTAMVFAPDILEDRSSTENVYGRVAQYEQSLGVFLEHPMLGVGFSNFNNFVAEDPQYRMSYEGVSSLDWPHSNLGEALTETGIVGFVPYMAMHTLLFLAMWQLRRLSRSGHVVWKYFIYMFLTYWITGLTESSGFEFLNVWYVFAIAVCYKYVLTDPYIQPAEALAPEGAFSASTRIFSPAIFQ